MCWLAPDKSSFQKCLFKSFTHFKIEIFVFFIAIIIIYKFSIQVTYQVYEFQIFSSILSVVFSLSWWCSLKHKLQVIKITCMFSCKCFVIVEPTFISVIYFDLFDHKNQSLLPDSQFYSIDLFVYSYASTHHFVVSFKAGKCKFPNFFSFSTWLFWVPCIYV